MLEFLSCSTRSTIFFSQIWNKRVEGITFQFVSPKIIKGAGFFLGGGGGAVEERGSTKGIYWYFQRVIMMKPTLKKQHKNLPINTTSTAVTFF